MIDTDKYEGHTAGPWEWWNDYIRDTSENELHIAKMEYDYKSADAQLIADAPLLREEVERLRSIADDLYAYIVSDADISLSTIEEQMDWRLRTGLGD